MFVVRVFFGKIEGTILDLDRVRKVAFLLRKLESKMFEKAGGRDVLKYLCINLAISSSPDCCTVSRLCYRKTLLFFCFLVFIKINCFG